LNLKKNSRSVDFEVTGDGQVFGNYNNWAKTCSINEPNALAKYIGNDIFENYSVKRFINITYMYVDPWTHQEDY
jgi:hypothetical protein